MSTLFQWPSGTREPQARQNDLIRSLPPVLHTSNYPLLHNLHCTMSAEANVVVYRSRTKRAAAKVKVGQGVQDISLAEDRKLIVRQMLVDCERSTTDS